MLTTERRERFGAVLFYGSVLLMLYLIYLIFQPFLVPLGWAIVLVVCFYPVHMRIEKRMSRSRAALVSTLIVTLLLIVPAALVLSAFIKESLEAAQSFQSTHAGGPNAAMNAFRDFWQKVQQHLPILSKFDPVTVLTQGVDKLGGFIAARAGSVVRNIAVFLLDLLLAIFAMYFFFRDGEGFIAGMRRIMPVEAKQGDELLAQARNLINASVTSGLIIAVVQGLLGGLAFAGVGFSAPVFWGVMMAFFSLVPMVGSSIVWVPGVIYLFIVGQTVRAIVLLAICAVVISSVDNVLRPILLRGKTPLNSLLIFIGVLGGVSVFGMLGLVLGPIVIATAATILRTYSQGESGASASGAVLQ